MKWQLHILVYVLLTAPCWASESDTIAFDFYGVVEADPAGSSDIRPLSTRLYIVWVCELGHRIQAGEAFIAYDSQGMRDRAISKDLEMVIERLSLTRSEIQSQNKLDELFIRQQTLTSDLQKAANNRQAAGVIDNERVALLATRYQQARKRLTEANLAAQLQLEYYQEGRVSREDLNDAERQAKEAKIDAESARTRWQQTINANLELAIASTTLAEQRIATELGGKSDTPSGIAAEIAAAEKKINRELKSRRESIERLERQFSDTLTTTIDAFPVQQLTIRNSNGEIVATLNPEQQVPAIEGKLVNWAQPFDDQALVISGAATWSPQLPADTYSIDVTYGGSRSWAGAALHIHNQQIIVEDRLEPQTYTHATTVNHGGGPLVLRFGGPGDRTQRAPKDGIITIMDWVDVGSRIRSEHYPIAYLFNPTSLRIKARIHQDFVPFLRIAASSDTTAADSDNPIRILQENMATKTVDVYVDEKVGEATVSTISDRPVTVAWNLEKSRSWHTSVRTPVTVGRELNLQPEKDSRLNSFIGKQVTLRAQLSPPTGSRIIPAHLVVSRNGRLFVQVQGEKSDREVIGLRIGQQYVVINGLSTQEKIVPPSHTQRKNAGTLTFTGEVVAGATVPVVIGPVFGEVAECIPDGSTIEVGQEIMTLRNQRLEAEQENIERQKTKREREALTEAEQRRVAAIRRSFQQREKQIDLELLSLRITEARTIDEQKRSDATSDFEQRTLAMNEAQKEYETITAAPNMPTQRIADAKRKLDLATISWKASKLDLITANHVSDWLNVMELETNLHEKLENLAMREDELAVEQASQIAKNIQATLRAEQEGWWSGFQERFNKHKRVLAPASGHLAYRETFNFRAGRYMTLDRGSGVWGGTKVADILDLSQLSFEVDLPEYLYSTLQDIEKVQLRFPQLSSTNIEATLESIGGQLFLPEDDIIESDGIITGQRFFTARIAFDVPSDLVGRLMPGAKGEIVLP